MLSKVDFFFFLNQETTSGTGTKNLLTSLCQHVSLQLDLSFTDLMFKLDISNIITTFPGHHNHPVCYIGGQQYQLLKERQIIHSSQSKEQKTRQQFIKIHMKGC